LKGEGYAVITVNIGGNDLLIAAHALTLKKAEGRRKNSKGDLDPRVNSGHSIFY